MQKYYINIAGLILVLLIKTSYASDLFLQEHFDPRAVIQEAEQNMEHFPAASKYNIAVAHDALGHVSQALQWYWQAYDDPTVTRSIKGAVLNNMAVLLQDNGHFDKALFLFIEGTKYEASHVFYNFGLICWDASNIAKAEYFFDRAQKLISDPRSLVNRGVCLYKGGHAGQAVGCWYRAWEKYKDPLAAYNMSIAAADRGDMVRARGWIKKAAEYNCSEAQAIVVPRCSSRR